MIFSIFRVVKPSPQSNFDHFHHSIHPPKNIPYPLAVTAHFPTICSSPRQPIIYFLSLYICLFWIFHINGIIEYVFQLA